LVLCFGVGVAENRFLLFAVFLEGHSFRLLGLGCGWRGFVFFLGFFLGNLVSDGLSLGL